MMNVSLITHHFLCTTSTQKIARLFPGDDVVITATQQYTGEGQRDRPWISPCGNFFGTWIVSGAIAEKGIISPAIALAVTETLNEWGITCEIKWPNDVLYQEKKLSGILIESQVKNRKKRILIGIGINVVPVSWGNLQAISMKDLVQKRVSLVMLKRVLHQKLGNVIAKIQTSGFSSLQKVVEKRLCWLGEKVLLWDKDRELRGIFVGIDRSGFVLVKDNEGCIFASSQGRLVLQK